MDVLLSSTSSHTISNPLFQTHNQRRTCHIPPPPFRVSCRSATKLKSETTTCGNFYKMLSVSPGSATVEEIKKAYRSMALQYHPDVCQDPELKEESTRMFVQLNAAYETLSNPMLRAEYDCELGLMRRNNNINMVNDQIWRNRWQEQLVELKNKSRRRMQGQKGGSWGTRMRRTSTQNMN